MTTDAGTRAPVSATPLRARRQAVTRQDIADAALELFERQGYESTTVEQIAGASGVSLRTFYRYCPSKDDALTSGLTTGPRNLATAVREHPELPLIEAVITAFVAVSETELRRRELRLIIHTPALRAAWLAAGREAQDDLIDVILERSPTLSPLYARARAAAITGVLTMVIETWASGGTARLEPVTREALGVIASD